MMEQIRRGVAVNLGDSITTQLDDVICRGHGKIVVALVIQGKYYYMDRTAFDKFLHSMKRLECWVQEIAVEEDNDVLNDNVDG